MFLVGVVLFVVFLWVAYFLMPPASVLPIVSHSKISTASDDRPIVVAEPETGPQAGLLDTAATGSNIKRRFLSWVLPLGTAAIYLAFPTKNYYWDGISFASSIENASGLSNSLIHPHHLLYNVFGYEMYQLTQFLGWHIRAVQVLQISNGILGGVCVWLLFRFLNRTLCSVWISTLLTLLFSFSSTWWKYATDADAYVPSVMLLLVCLNLLLTVEKIRPVLLALVHTASMCLHQLALFFFPAVVIGIFLQRDRHTLRERLRLVSRYCGVAVLTTLATNYYCFHWQTGTFGLVDFGRWLTSYVQGPASYSFSFNVLSNLSHSLSGQVRLFFAGRFNWIQGLISLPLVLLLGVLILLVLTLSSRLLRSLPSIRFRLPLVPAIDDRFKPLVGVCSVWLAVYLVFLFFWYPYFTPYRLFYLAPLICLGGVFLVQKDRLRSHTRRANAAMLVTAMAISNFAFFILPLSRTEKYPPLSFALQMNERWAPGTVIFYAKDNADNALIRYFNPSTTWRALPAGSIGPGSDDTFRSRGKFWLDASAMVQMQSLPDGAAWLSAHTRNDCTQKLVNHSYRIEFIEVFPSVAAAKASADCSLIAYVHEDTFK